MKKMNKGRRIKKRLSRRKIEEKKDKIEVGRFLDNPTNIEQRQFSRLNKERVNKTSFYELAESNRTHF